MFVTYRKSLCAHLSRLALIIATILFFLVLIDPMSVSDACVMLIYAFNLMWISNLMFCIDDYKNRYILLVLNLTYFLFYMGRVTFSYLLKHDYSLGSSYVGIFSDNITRSTFLIIFCGLFFIRVFSVVMVKPSRVFTTHDTNIKWTILNRIAYQLYWITLPAAIAVVLERAIFVQVTGYASFYTSFRSSLPSIIVKLNGFNEILFFLFLGTFPDKTTAKRAITPFLLLGVLSLFYGQRNPLAIKFIFIFLIYIPLRDSLVGDEQGRWLTRKIKFFCLISIPALIIFFSIWKYARNDITYDGGLSELILDFFDTEGNSAYLIALALDNLDKFPEGVYYVLGPIHDFLTNNAVYKMFFGASFAVSSRTYEGVVNLWTIGGLLSYFQSPRAFAAGVGTGTCYLVEAFIDFGYFGIALISFIYVRIITFVQNFRGTNWLLFSIGLISSYEILYAPRDLALSFVNEFFSFSFIAMVAIIYFLYKRRTEY